MNSVINETKVYFRRITKFNREKESRRKIEIYLMELSPLGKSLRYSSLRRRIGGLASDVLQIAEQHA
jgi:hypothetical protein